MASDEQVLYRNQWEGATPLSPALAHLKDLGGSLETSYNPRLITTGLGGMNDAQVAGLTANCDIGFGSRAETMVWTIRWDFDPDKGAHVNGNFRTSAYGTEKFAWLELNEGDDPSNPILSASYGPTLKKFTSDCGWDIEVWNAKDGSEKDAYKAQCAAQGLSAWTARLSGGGGGDDS